MILNERSLRMVVVLSEELHFGRAAQKLHLSQPALSGTLKSLENELGTMLFLRTSRNVVPTAAGNVLATEARRLLEDGRRTLALVRNCRSDLAGPLRVGFSSAANLRWVGSLIARTRTEGMGSGEVEFISMESNALMEELATGNVQAAIVAGCLRTNEALELTRIGLFREPFAAAMGSDHPLAGAGTIDTGTLRDVPLVWLRRGSDPVLEQIFTEFCAAYEFRPNIAQEVRNFPEALAFARQGVGIALVPRWMKGDAPGSVVFREVAQELYLEHSLAFHAKRGAEILRRFLPVARTHRPELFDQQSGSIRPEETINS